MKERIVYYNCKAFCSQIKSGNEYYMLQKTINIIITDYDIIKEDDIYRHKFLLYDNDNNVTFTDIIEHHVLELSKIPIKSDNTNLYDWLKFLSAESEEEFDMLAKKNDDIKKAVTVVKIISEDERQQMLYESRMKSLADEKARLRLAEIKAIQQGLKQGIQQGIEQHSIQTAKNMLSDNLHLIKLCYILD